MEGNLMAEREIRKDLFSWRRKRKKKRKKKKGKKKVKKEPVSQVDHIKVANRPVRSCGGRFLSGL